MNQVLFVVAYDGTDYHGFERQVGLPTIQGVLEQTLTRLLGPGVVVGASRTDAGVHAEGQVAVWRGACPIPLSRWADVVNRQLPSDIRVRNPRWVPDGWDPRRQARAKQYGYRIWRGPVPAPPAWRRWVVEWPEPVDWRVLQEAARLAEGVHDFRAFRNEGSSAVTTVRHIYASRWDAEANGHIWRYRVTGNGFLYRMVRHLVGQMWAAARQGDLETMRAALDRAVKVTEVAPAKGLVLETIWFDEFSSARGH